jgi:hypothetical protein
MMENVEVPTPRLKNFRNSPTPGDKETGKAAILQRPGGDGHCWN